MYASIETKQYKMKRIILAILCIVACARDMNQHTNVIPVDQSLIQVVGTQFLIGDIITINKGIEITSNRPVGKVSTVRGDLYMTHRLHIPKGTKATIVSIDSIEITAELNNGYLAWRADDRGQYQLQHTDRVIAYNKVGPYTITHGHKQSLYFDEITCTFTSY